jgi:RNA polymerase sigma-70 factor (ECF subfamily)
MSTISNVSGQDALYERSVAEYGPALVRLARGYEADPEKRRDLVQEIHLALWRSFERFDERCSLRTWVYRVAHNTAVSWVIVQKRARPEMLVSLDEAQPVAVAPDTERRIAVDRLTELIRQLKPLDRQVILLYLEGMDAAEIGDVAGISPGNVATKIHRIKSLLTRQFNAGVSHGE